MTTLSDAWREPIERDGFALLAAVYTAGQVEAILEGLRAAVLDSPAARAAVLGEAGGVYAARNVLQLWPEAADVWRLPPLQCALEAVLGPGFGLVRGLFFDKPPAQTWALPWHKDLTIAVRDHRRPSPNFRKPTLKAGVPHVEAPVEVLRDMLTARIHLDDVTEENGPLKVVPGSHHAGKALELGAAPPRSVLACRGDVLLIRPLVAHCSNRSHPDTRRHRRILHLEFAASAELPDGYAWHAFRPAGRAEAVGQVPSA